MGHEDPNDPHHKHHHPHGHPHEHEHAHGHPDSPAEEHRHAAPAQVATWLITCSDTRTARTDESGRIMREALEGAGHPLAGQSLVRDDAAALKAELEKALAAGARAVVISGGSDADAVRLARALRLGAVPVFTRVKGSEVRVNMTTILPDEEGDLVRALADLLAAPG